MGDVCAVEGYRYNKNKSHDDRADSRSAQKKQREFLNEAGIHDIFPREYLNNIFRSLRAQPRRQYQRLEGKGLYFGETLPAQGVYNDFVSQHSRLFCLPQSLNDDTVVRVRDNNRG